MSSRVDRDDTTRISEETDSEVSVGGEGNWYHGSDEAGLKQMFKDAIEKEILQKLIDFRIQQKKKHAEYEKNRCYPMAYLAIWSVFEESMKNIGELSRRKTLREKLQTWADYLDGKGKKPLKEIKACSLESQTIPDIKLIESYLGSLSETVKKVHKSKGKYRNARNAAAHKAEFPKKEETYVEYVRTVREAADDLINCLQEKCC